MEMNLVKMDLIEKKKRKGFTLIELIVVIAIIAILAAIAIPRFTSFTGSANRKSVQATLKSIDSAAAVVAADKGKTLADVTQAEVLAQLGWDAMPTNSPKLVAYTCVNGAATATVDITISWSGEDLTATKHTFTSATIAP